MPNIQGVIGFVIIGLLCFIVFIIYFIFKILQFIIQATNLYKDMVTRQDLMIKLLKDLREHLQKRNEINTRSELAHEPSEETHLFCTNCGAKVSSNSISHGHTWTHTEIFLCRHQQRKT